jgi:methylenetetrahydrofolate--tRNA-(uracil-5-)-methyltransferase
VVGGGLAGSEAAWQLAQRDVDVHLFEMRPNLTTGAHQSDQLAELVCSNSLGSKIPTRATGVLFSELEAWDSLLVDCAKRTAVPAGGALAVDRVLFAEQVTQRLAAHPKISIYREEVRQIPEGISILATGPLTSDALSDELVKLSGEDHLYFFDALSPIVELESIDFSIAFRGSRYGRGERDDGDYLNCPFDETQYSLFVQALKSADRIPLRAFENAISNGVRAGMADYFEGCLPAEVIAERGELALAYGPMRPVGLKDPAKERRPFAVVQLRQDDLADTIYNLVGFQTNLTFSEQRRVFRMIPGLQNARFVRYGQMHRNTFLNSPMLLLDTLQFKSRSQTLAAGQITGVEGYAGNIATGLLAGVNAARMMRGLELISPPRTSMLGALCHYISHAEADRFQPMKANFGILPPLDDGTRRNRSQRREAHAQRASRHFSEFLRETQETLRIAI